MDTHLILWSAGHPERLSGRARQLLEDPVSELWFSSASMWEIALKGELGRDDFRVEPRRLRRGLIEGGWRELSISTEHAVATLGLPPIHRDPFDRMLVAQAHVEGCTLLTSDSTVAQYPGPVHKV